MKMTLSVDQHRGRRHGRRLLERVAELETSALARAGIVAGALHKWIARIQNQNSESRMKGFSFSFYLA